MKRKKRIEVTAKHRRHHLPHHHQQARRRDLGKIKIEIKVLKKEGKALPILERGYGTSLQIYI